jgi:hypothetical protein
VVFREIATPSQPGSPVDEALNDAQWEVRTRQAGPDDYLLVASQDCDITKGVTKEPHIEVLFASWDSDTAAIAMARGKSYHFRLLGLRDGADGKEEGLIADAAWRALLDKQTLIALHPDFYEPPRGVPSTAAIQDWLGARFNRMALPDDVVDAVQRPLVAAIRKLGKTNKLHATMAKIDYVLCVRHGTGSPMEIEFWFVVDEDGETPSIAWAETAELVQWIESVVSKEGKAKIVNWDQYTTDMISFRQFNSQLLLDLDQFSLAE